MPESESTLELGKYVEDDDEDYSDLFDLGSGPSSLGTLSIQASSVVDGQLR
jgi:hypothetical protein